MSIIECPVCGNVKATVMDVTWAIQEPYGSKQYYSVKISKCEVCNESVTLGDYDSEVIPAINRSRKTSVITMLKFFNENGYTTANLERIFGLHQRSIDKYLEADEVEPSFIMLLLTYRSFFPGLLQAADNVGGFNRGTLVTDTK